MDSWTRRLKSLRQLIEQDQNILYFLVVNLTYWRVNTQYDVYKILIYLAKRDVALFTPELIDIIEDSVNAPSSDNIFAGAELLLLLGKHGKYYLKRELLIRLEDLFIQDKVEIDELVFDFYIRLLRQRPEAVSKQIFQKLLAYLINDDLDITYRIFRMYRLALEKAPDLLDASNFNALQDMLVSEPLYSIACAIALFIKACKYAPQFVSPQVIRNLFTQHEETFQILFNDSELETALQWAFNDPHTHEEIRGKLVINRLDESYKFIRFFLVLFAWGKGFPIQRVHQVLQQNKWLWRNLVLQDKRFRWIFDLYNVL